MGAYARIRLGYDSSGRPIDTDKRQKQFFDIVCADSGVTPTIVQGAYRAGAGATASAGTHDGGGVFDLRTWNLTTDQRSRFQWSSRRHGGTCWYRTPAQGFDYHMHDGLLGHKTASSGLKQQFSMYLNGYNGLASWAKDDFKRPSPIPRFKYKKAKAKPRINLTHLLAAWKRPKGEVFNPWGIKANRALAKALQKKGCLDHYTWKHGFYGKSLRKGVRRANKKYGIKKWTGPKDDRVTYALLVELGFQPYRTKREKKPTKRRIKKVVVSKSKTAK